MNLINHLYSRDISKKVKSAYRTRWKKGVFTNGRAPYWYIKDSDAQGGWKVDPEAGKVVRFIFDKALHGWTTKMIAEHLNKEGVITPGKYRFYQIGDRGGMSKVPEKEILWNTGMICAILHRYEYTGAFVGHHHRRLQVGKTQVEKVPMEERYITEDAHEAIVSKEEFELAKQAIKTSSSKAYKVKQKYPLQGKIKCGNCGLAVAYSKEYHYIYCPHKISTGSLSQCFSERCDYRIIEKLVVRELKRMIDELSGISNHMEKIKQDEQRDDSSNAIKRKNRIGRLKMERMLLYESFVDGKITKKEYLEKREKLANEINELEDVEKKIEDQNLKEHQINDTMKKYLSYGDCLFEIGMTKELADVFIDTIYVHDTKRIEIVFTFTDFLKDAKKYLQEKETMVCNVRKET